jgi:chemotaxis protein MotA
MKRFESTVLVGLLIGIGAIGASVLLEGIKLRFLWQPTAALVVLGGTIGAVTVRCGISGLGSLLREMFLLFRVEPIHNEEAIIARLTWLARTARREGPRVFEQYADASGDRLVSRALALAGEYAEPSLVRSAADTILEHEDREGRRQSTLLESAGGYAPTFGILGAVLGMIHVLRSLDNPSALGTGIATAFVATIYGIGLANLLFFPLASRLRERHESQMRRREALADALVAISAHESPAYIKRLFSEHPSFEAGGVTVRELSNRQ